MLAKLTLLSSADISKDDLITSMHDSMIRDCSDTAKQIVSCMALKRSLEI